MSRSDRIAVERLERRCLLSGAVEASAIWTALNADYWDDQGARAGSAVPAEWTIGVAAVRVVALDETALRHALADAPAEGIARLDQMPVLVLPTPEGGFARFAVERTAVLAPIVAVNHPEVGTFRGYGVDDVAAVAHFDLTANGFHASVATPSGAWAVAPAVADAGGAGGATYAAYYLADQPIADVFVCEVGDDHDHDHDHGGQGLMSALAPLGPTRVTVRLAVAATAEWVVTAGGTVASAFGTIVTAVNEANLVYNRDHNVAFTLVSGTNLVYTNPTTDPYTDNNGSTLLNENQANLDAVIGNANYDIGHIFSTSGGGVANLGVVGEPGRKARGNSGRVATSSIFQITFFHEMGHQFNAHHSFNYAEGNSGQRSASSAYEPGPGSTIMSYGGFGFAGDYVTIRDRYFHGHSIQRIDDYLTFDSFGAAAGTRTPTGNAAPIVSAGADYVIPANTPFELIGTGSDAQPVSYGWEQFDLGDEDPIGLDDGNGPLFRSRPAVATPARSFPELADVLADRSDADERLPQVSRVADPLTFRLIARDSLGGVSWDEADLTVISTGAAFAITSQNAGATWAAGSTQTVSWNVAGTTGNSINAAAVDVYLSYDGGQTFTLALENAVNDGSADFLVPANAPATSAARVKIKARGNVFFDINNAAITIVGDATAPAVVAAAFDFERGHAVTFDFSEPIDPATVQPGDLAVVDVATGLAVPAGRFTVAQLAPTRFAWVYDVATFGPLPDANYTATLAAGSVADFAGNTLAQSAALDFFAVAGDATRDRRVNLADFGVLRANFGGTDRTFSQGDFNYDGVVNLADFGILRANFGTYLPPPGGNLFGDGNGGDGDEDGDEGNLTR